MENKYLKFIEGMSKITSNEAYSQCEMLIKKTKDFYCLYKQSTALSKVLQLFSSFYNLEEIENGRYKVKLKENQLDFSTQAILNFYLNHFVENPKDYIIDEYLDVEDEKNTKTDFKHQKKAAINAAIDEAIEDLGEEDLLSYGIENITFDGKPLSLLIVESCEFVKTIDFEKTYTVKEEKISKGLRLLKKYKNMPDIPEEECFNSVLADWYVDVLCSLMGSEFEPFLHFWITPIRLTMTDKEENGRTSDSKSIEKCRKKGYRKEIADLKRTIAKAKAFEDVLIKYQKINQKLKQIEKPLEVNF